MIDAAPKAETFKLRSPLLSKGRLDTVIAETDLMQVRMKCYAEGGENVLHAHTNEDHFFVVLQGQATFHDQDDQVTTLGRNEGIMLPRGAYYWFQSSGDEPLVMLRVGAKQGGAPVPRIGPDGKPLPGHSKENKHEEPEIIEGAFYE
jgi:mannose-6-phosphate isomerase-like protein (cupin superfamily)